MGELLTVAGVTLLGAATLFVVLISKSFRQNLESKDDEWLEKRNKAGRKAIAIHTAIAIAIPFALIGNQNESDAFTVSVFVAVIGAVYWLVLRIVRHSMIAAVIRARQNSHE